MTRRFKVFLLLTGIVVLIGVASVISYTIGTSNSASSNSTNEDQSDRSRNTSKQSSERQQSSEPQKSDTDPAEPEAKNNPTQNQTRPSSTGSANPSACRDAQLTITINSKRGDATAGGVYKRILFKNTSQATCTIYGYPGVSLRASNGSIVGKPADHSKSPTSTVSLTPGTAGHAVLTFVQNKFPAGTCKNGANKMYVYAPANTAYSVVETTQSTWCPGFSVGPVTR